MGWFVVSADTFARSRFAVSPLAETTASLLTLDRGTAVHPGERAWLDAHRAAYLARIAPDPVVPRLIRAAAARYWVPDLITAVPGGPGPAYFADELAALRDRPAEQALWDLPALLDGSPAASLLGTTGLSRRAAELLGWVWTETVRPEWPRRRRVLEADIAARTARLAAGGWAAALDGMGDGVRWLGEGRLQVNGHDNPPREISGAELLFVPVTPQTGWTTWDTAGRYAVMYACSGALADPGAPAAAPRALAALLGPARAAVLTQLGTPKTTTQLVLLTGQGLGSVGRHLKILADAGLLHRRRTGRSVLYSRSPAGDLLVRVQDGGIRR